MPESSTRRNGIRPATDYYYFTFLAWAEAAELWTLATVDELIVEVAQFHFLHEAELAATALRAAGIECAIPDRFGRTPENIFTGATFRLLVKRQDYDRAREVLA